MSKRDEILKLRDSGMTLEAIGERFGISKERVRQIIKESPSPVPRRDFETMLTVRGAAQLLGVHINTVRRWTNSGMLPSYRLGSRRDRRLRREDVETFLEQSKQ